MWGVAHVPCDAAVSAACQTARAVAAGFLVFCFWEWRWSSFSDVVLSQVTTFTGPVGVKLLCLRVCVWLTWAHLGVSACNCVLLALIGWNWEAAGLCLYSLLQQW